MSGLNLTLRQRASWLAHAAKSVTQDHHRALAPLIATVLPRDGIAVDVGAHAGQMARLFARAAPAGRVYAFEPSAYARSILSLAIACRGVRNITVIACALGDSEGTLTLATPLKRASRSMGYGLAHITDAPAQGAFAETVRVTTLDAFAAAQALARVDFVKCDVEGYEGRFLAGAAQTIARFKPALLIELNADHLARAGDAAQAVFAGVLAHGYRGAILEAGAPRPAPAYAGPGDYLFTPA